MTLCIYIAIHVPRSRYSVCTVSMYVLVCLRMYLLSHSVSVIITVGGWGGRGGYALNANKINKNSLLSTMLVYLPPRLTTQLYYVWNKRVCIHPHSRLARSVSLLLLLLLLLLPVECSLAWVRIRPTALTLKSQVQ